MSDVHAAVKEFCFDIDRMIANAEGLRLSPQVEDLEALELAIVDLISAKAMFIDALIGTDVVQ